MREMENYKGSLGEAARFLREHDHFLVVNHVNPDGDATGSLLAVGCLLHRLGKTFTLVNEGETPGRFSFLPMYEKIINLSESPLTESYRYVIAVDSADRERMGIASHFFAEDVLLLNIDHHPTNDRYGDVNVIRDDAASTTEVIYELLEEMGEELDHDLATCLYTGLLTDTGGFRYANTTAEVMYKAADLLKFGVSPSKVAERCLELKSEAYLKLLQRSLSSLEVIEDGKLSHISITLDDMAQSGAGRDDVDGIVNYPRNIETVEVAICFKQVEENIVKVSFRSREKVDVAAIAKLFGGGGHIRASGCTVEGTLEQVKEKVLHQVKQDLQQSR